MTTEPCRREWRCVGCHRLRSLTADHVYRRGDEKPLDHPCEKIAVCARCGYELPVERHDKEPVAVFDLPEAERPHYFSWESASLCDYVLICRRCGERDRYFFTEHQWSRPSWGGVCAHCGEDWFDDGE
ncbi:hypothetical protein [Streptomyces albiaxialis]|uniref:hypothetical protein n=1 Tax=Streptomyces albiaxialis TaxID=329523 RepID=UPI0031DB8787